MEGLFWILLIFFVIAVAISIIGAISVIVVSFFSPFVDQKRDHQAGYHDGFLGYSYWLVRSLLSAWVC